MRVTTLMLVLAALAMGAIPTAQVPLPDTLRQAQRVYLVADVGVQRAQLDRVALEIRRWRPSRWTLVATAHEADIVLTLSRGAGDPGVVVVPFAGVGLWSLPLDDGAYQLVVTATTSSGALWHDRRTVTGTHGGAVADLVKDLLKRLKASQVEAGAVVR